jgi:hypothetical protein
MRIMWWALKVSVDADVCKGELLNTKEWNGSNHRCYLNVRISPSPTGDRPSTRVHHIPTFPTQFVELLPQNKQWYTTSYRFITVLSVPPYSSKSFPPISGAQRTEQLNVRQLVREYEYGYAKDNSTIKSRVSRMFRMSEGSVKWKWVWG